MNKLMEELASMFQGTFRVRVQWRLSTRHRPFNAAYTIPPYELVFDRQLRPEIFLALPRTWLWMRRRFCCTLTLWKDKASSHHTGRHSKSCVDVARVLRPIKYTAALPIY